MAQHEGIHRWYNDNAHEFAEADAIELPFVGMPRVFQERLNRFKLWAIEQGGAVTLTGKHVLEFGAGQGRLAFAFPDMASYLGVDSSQNMVDIGNRRLQGAGLADRATLVRGDVLTFSTERQFDVVCSLGMMSYFEDPDPVITAMAKFVQPGGSLFFDFRNHSWIYEPIRRIKWLLNPPTGGTTYVAKRAQIAAALLRSGFFDVRFVAREFPLLAERYARTAADWPLALRNRLAASTVARPLATEGWVFGRRPSR